MENQNLFKVKKVQLVSSIKLTTGDKVVDTNLGDTQSFGIFREDTGSWLGTVGKQYEIMQNDEMFEVVRKAAEVAGLESSAVEFKEYGGGRKVSCQVKLPEWDVSNSGDIVKRYVTALNSHDGSSSFGLGLLGHRMFCQNQWINSIRNVSRIRHGASMKARVEAMANDMYKAISFDKELYEMFNTMADTPVKT